MPAAKKYDMALEYYLKLEQTEDLKAKEYALAQTCYDEGFFAEAVQLYEILGQNQLSVSKLPMARYAYAMDLFENEYYSETAWQFSLPDDFDSAMRAKESTYLYGKQLMEHGL